MSVTSEQIAVRSLSVPTSEKSLQYGDHLEWDEYLHRCEHNNHASKTELLFGKVYMTPRRYTFHDQPISELTYLLMTYAKATEGVEASCETTLRQDKFNAPEPDLLMRLIHGGGSYVDGEGYLTGTPEFIMEVAASSVNYDLFEKKDLYQQIGVKEYVVWRTEDAQFDAFDLVDGKFVPRDVTSTKRWESKIFPGFVLDLPSLLKGEYKQALTTLQQSLNSPAHAAFVADLQARKK